MIQEKNILKELKYIYPNKTIKDLKKIKSGRKNYNFYFKINNDKYIFRLKADYKNAYKKSKKEYYNLIKINKILPQNTPKIYFFKRKGKFIPFSYLIIEYIEGKEIKFNKNNVKQLAKVVSKLHLEKVKFLDRLFLTKRIYKFISEKYLLNKEKKIIKKNNCFKFITIFGDKLIKKNKIKNIVLSYIHSDIQSPNIIENNNNLFLIDIEFLEIGDRAYDLGKLFLDSNFLKYKDIFLKEYIKYTKMKNIEQEINKYVNIQKYIWILSDLKSYVFKDNIISLKDLKKSIIKNYNALKKCNLTEDININNFLDCLK
ncbi:MAG: hypothetical protein PHR26_01410 [Candidatus ainarchaeum sp.]|nr:hypothetical protein [Candidatus ainarchaeum sp.]MDD3976296.1 hypothetical protein [Candidatus ainarchaeum sp.]